jgi:hypothetical protein
MKKAKKTTKTATKSSKGKATKPSKATRTTKATTAPKPKTKPKKKKAGAKPGKFTPGDFEFRVGRSRTGLGLYALSPIAKGACVIEYIGRDVTEKEVEASRSKYLFEVTKTRTIDGAPRWNIARYINHSCRPNCEVDIWRGHVYVLAKRKIQPGEELNYNYGKDYLDTFIRPKGCKCAKCDPPKVSARRK